MQAASTTLSSLVMRHVVLAALCLGGGATALPAQAARVADPLAYGSAPAP